MKKLFLTSGKLDRLVDLFDKNPNQYTVAFIANAADLHPTKWFVEVDREKFRGMGFKIRDVDLKKMNEKKLEKELQNINIIYVSGGNVFYLLDLVRKSGFDKIIYKLLDKGIIYAGGSAGATLAGTTIELVKWLDIDDPKTVPHLKNYQGLGLVDFIVLPHHESKEYRTQYKKMFREYKMKNQKIIKLTDDEAMIVEGDRIKIVK